MTRMLNSKALKKIHSPFLSLLMVMLLGLLSSCMPQATAPSTIQDSNSTNNTNNTNNNYSEPSFPTSSIFIQESGNQFSTYFSLPINFSDSFLVRGKSLSQYLRTLPNTTRFCLVGKYTYNTGTDKFLVLAAKPKSYTDLVNKTTEFYLQVEPSNDQSNQNDCLTYNLTNSLYSSVTPPTVPAASFSLSQLCSDCNSSVTSEGLKLYFNNGELVPTLNLSMLTLTISGSTTSSGNSCVESTVCKARGYDCCLDGQCVTDGAIKPGAITDPGFATAQSDVASNPNRFVLYPQYYFVCTNRPEDEGSEDNNDPVDPAYEANIRIMELNQLYQCLNKVDGEFSYCTVKFTSASTKISAGSDFSASEKGFLDDVNFSTLNPNFASGDYANNIVKIFYAGQTLYEANKTPLNAADGNFVSGTNNDNITSAQKVKITKALPVNAQDDNLYLTYKIDGSCEKLGSSLARCTKTYIQSSTETTSTSYHDSSKIFYLPSYADTSASSNIIVKISGIIVPEDASTWSKAQSPNRIIFSASYPLYQNQSIEITYYVTSGINDLLKSRLAAQATVNSMCICASTAKCNLKPIYNSSNVVTNFECTHPEATTNQPPANQTAYVSNKNVPHRYYDINGVNYDEDYSTALAQEGTAFSYISNNILKPSNLDAHTGYTGFNEIYGSFSKTSSTAARPAKMIKVKKDKIYDLFANSGVFSTCLTCGSDYYSSIQKIFPQSLTGIGGGYSPDKYSSKRVGNTGAYRSDDLLFGRACFIPVTMIPWTHAAAAQVTSQRRNRLAAQHFLFANGYNRDWYGFDYGSLIGSFDGVTWFSIGNQRRIKATSNRLFLAVNAYYGDQNVDSNFNVTVSETTAYSGTLPDHDTETTGAECQRSHFCSNDNDCFRQLGYDYTCQNVGTITTSWPVSDANGTEVIGSSTRTLSSLLGGTNGQSKRCVYRGRGAPCHANLTSLSSTFNTATQPGLLACSTNSMCQPFASGANNRFNDRIARFANTPVAQNSANAAPTASDTVGLGARVLGRPYDFYGTKTAPTVALTGLTGNNVAAICIPGKNISGSIKTYDLNSSSPSSRTDSSDKILAIGTTMSGNQNPKYLNSCPATDNIGVSLQQYDLNLGDASTINLFTTSQNLSTNLLDIPAITAQNVFSSTNGSQITAIGYQRNSCLRAPGASCFSDMDCAPSEFIASKVKAATLTGILNAAEERYWEEDLTCGNPDFKFVQTGVLNPDFDPKKNTCCRDFGKTFTVYTQDASSDHYWCDPASPGTGDIQVAGVNRNINSYNRYSRVHTAYDKMTCKISEISTTKSFALSLNATSLANRHLQLNTQYKTLDTVNSRTCCTKHWVRSFATTNGGGHKWGQNKLQVIDKKNFRGLNWVGTDTTGGNNVTPYECDVANYLEPSCEIRNFSQADTELYLNFFGAFDLVGIPQVRLMSDNHVMNTNDNDDGSGDDLDLSAPDGTVLPFASFSNSNLDSQDSSGKGYYSAINYSALQSQMKKVFSENEFNCCIPSGQQVPDGTTAEQCCTGYIGNTGASELLRCCMPDFTDLTVYLSRYVSSEGRGLPDSAYDPNTGYIKDPGVVELLAAQKNLCCSGKTARGVGIRKLPIPMPNGTWVNQDDAWTKRFVQYSNAIDNNSEFGPIGQLFDAGLRWNNHVYCIPAGLEIPEEK